MSTKAEKRQELKSLLAADVSGKPFNELYGVSFDHRSVALLGDALLDALEENGYPLESFDAVGALTAASVPLVGAMMGAAAKRGAEVDGFVMDFVYPSIKGPSIKSKRVVLLDAWLSEKSYVQTSSLVTLRNGNELSLDFSVVEHEGAQVVAIVSLIGGVGGQSNTDDTEYVADGAAHMAGDGAKRSNKDVLVGGVDVLHPDGNSLTHGANSAGMASLVDDEVAFGAQSSRQEQGSRLVGGNSNCIAVVNPIDGCRSELPFVAVFDEAEFKVVGRDEDGAGAAKDDINPDEDGINAGKDGIDEDGVDKDGVDKDGVDEDGIDSERVGLGDDTSEFGQGGID